MLTRNRATLALSGTARRNKPSRSQRPRCVSPAQSEDPAGLSKEPRPGFSRTGDGIFYSLALTFGTLLSSQGTDASFVLTLSGFPPGASLRCFQPYQIRSPARSRPDSHFRPPAGAGLFGLPASAFRPHRLYQIHFPAVSGRFSVSESPVGGVSTTLADFPCGS
jgi:hypothetical protein